MATVVVHDDGGGVLADTDRAEGHGLLGMRERVEALGGRLCIGSTGNGLRIEAVIPIVGHDLNGSMPTPALPVYRGAIERDVTSPNLERVAA